MRLADFAKANGKNAVVAFKEEYFPLPSEVEDILNQFGVAVERF